MKIKSLQLKNFKRFTDLTLQAIPDDAKLVLLIGSNGSGKSSVFDAFELISDMIHRTVNTGGKFNSNSGYFSGGKEYSYYHKLPNLLQIDLQFTDYSAIQCKFRSLVEGQMIFSRPFTSNLFYGRSAVRYLPRITRTSIGRAIDISKDVDKPEYLIDEDKRFENDIDLLIVEVVEKIFKGINTENDQQLQEIRLFLNKINDAFPRIFGTGNGTKLRFRSFIPPADGKPSRLIFQKGGSELDYHLLSAGEKEVVNLLFNLFVRNKVYTDTIYFMDEIDAHLNTALQASLLKEITEYWVPESCQLWTASHSLGFIKYAQQSDQAVIFDLDDYDFDQPKPLTPEPKDNPNLYQIAVERDFLPHLFEQFNIVFVENKDAAYYASAEIMRTVFVPENGRNGVYHKVKSGEYARIVDRDFLTDEDIAEIEANYERLKVLKYYSIENYLYHPDNLQEYNATKKREFDKMSYIQKLVHEKNKIKGKIILVLSLKRTEYPYFGEPTFNGKSIQNRFKNKQENFDQSAILHKYLDSDNLEDFFKILPMKTYATDLPERQNMGKTELAKTKWFQKQIEALLK
jgi:predicted ATPase